MVIVTTLNNSEKLAKKIASKIGAKYSKTFVQRFPDGEIYLRFKTEVKNEKIIIVESFQPNSTRTLVNIIFASQTAKSLGAKKVVLFCPYLAFMRQDKRFKSGEAVSAQIMSKLLNENVDKVLTIDPHLHRIHAMKEIFTIPAKNLTANHVIAQFIKKHFKNEVVMGPDWESFQWADDISNEIGVEDTVLEKDRHSFRNVDVKVTKEISIKEKNVVIVDDIISTGNTMIKAAIEAKKRGAKTITAIGVHGLFVENAYQKMKPYFDNIYTVNTIEHETNVIDITSTIVEELEKRI